MASDDEFKTEVLAAARAWSSDLDTQTAYCTGAYVFAAKVEAECERLRERCRFLQQYLVTLKKLCPCGGIILADAEDLDPPLCDDCFSALSDTTEGTANP